MPYHHGHVLSRYPERLCCQVHGEAAHSSKPHLGKNALVAAAQLTKALKGEEGEKVREYIEEKKQAIVDEENEKLAEQEKELNEAQIAAIERGIRLPDKFLWKGFKARLFKNDCQNRGYVLDGYPRNYKDCIKIFTSKPP